MKTTDKIHEQVPLPFLIAAGLLVALTLFLITTTRLTGFGETKVPATETVAARNLRFEDQPSGAIAVYAAEDGRLVELMQPGTNGFLRGILRALVRERRQHGIGPSVPFRLAGEANGSLILEDPATGRRIVLGAFGPANSGVFAGLLTSGSNKQ